MTAPRASAFHSRFTPSMLPLATLEALFVQRFDLLARILNLVEESARTPTKHQILVVGPRGIGKTHLLALTYHRLKARSDLRERLCLAWLREEEWGVDSFFELLRRILLALDREYPQAGLRQKVGALREEPRETVRRVGEQLLIEFLAGRTLLVLCENLDDLFAGLGEQGQAELRSFLQEQGSCSLLATAQSLFDGISRQTAPFYAFFRPERLQGLSFDEAVDLVRRLAEHAGDEELATYLDTSEGRARMRAIQHLSGGNHRVYVVLSQFLTRKSLEELVPPLLDLLDALTPYYQSRMQVLEPAQRKLVEAMCARRGAATVEELAKDCFLEEAATRQWLRDLAGKGYASIRGSYDEPLYELQEPLLRLCLEVKAEREEPLRLLVEFLRLWYTRPELEQRLTILEPAALERDYIQVALSRGDATQEIIAACLQDFNQHFEQKEYRKAIRVAEEMLAVDPRSQQGWSLKVTSLWKAEERDQALEASQQFVSISVGDPVALCLRALLLMEVERWEEALPLSQQLTELAPEWVDGWLLKAWCLGDLHRWAESELASRDALRLQPESLAARDRLAASLYSLRRYQEAANFYEGFEWGQDEDDTYTGVYAALLMRIGRLSEAVTFVDKALQVAPGGGHLLALRAEIARRQNQPNEALRLLDQALQAAPDNWFAHLTQFQIYLSQDRLVDAARSIRAAEQTVPHITQMPEVWRAIAELALRQADMPRALDAMDTLLALQPDEEDAEWALVNRAIPLLAAGRFPEAETALRAALERRPKNAHAWSNLGATLCIVGRQAEAEPALRKALALDANYVGCMNNLAEMLSLQGRHSEALDLLVRATGLAPQRGDIWGHYAMVLARTGSLDKAHGAFTYARQHGNVIPVHRYEAIGIQIARHRWPDAVKELRQAVPTMSELEIAAFQAILRHLFQTREDALAWTDRTRKLVSLFRRHHKLPFLAQAVTQSIDLLRSAIPEDRQRWLAAWKASAHKEPQMQPALRLLETAVHYLDSPGPHPLLRLPPEERSLLLPLLQLHSDPTDPNLD